LFFGALTFEPAPDSSAAFVIRAALVIRIVRNAIKAR
jgi:hypothetical protein